MTKSFLSMLILGVSAFSSSASAGDTYMKSCTLLMNQLGESNIWAETAIPLSEPEDVVGFKASYGSVSVGNANVDITVYYHENGKTSVQQVLVVKDEVSIPLGTRSLQFHLKPFEINGKQYSHVMVNCL